MRRAVSTFLIVSLLATPGFGAPAITTANVNFRTGPGTSHGSLGVLPSGTEVDLQDCDDSGSWCAVMHEGRTGFVSGRYLKETGGETDRQWPRSFKVGDKEFVVLHQPQFSAWHEFTELEAVVAAEYYESEDDRPVFGVIGLSAETERDTEEGTIVAHDVKITQLDFSALDRDALVGLSLGLNELLPTDPIVLSEERVTASLASYQQVNDVEGLKADPPRILVSTVPARLLQTEGAPVFAPVKGAPGVEFAVNTNWDLFRIDDVLWLRDETAWLTATDISADWRPVTSLPTALQALPDDDNWTAVREALTPKPYDGTVPRILHSDAPAELILFDGAPAFEDVPGTGLEWASNTETDIFRLKETGTWYILLSGRWFSAPSLDGPWAFATPNLPDDFLNIPDDKPYYTVRASVPGTSEANEARLRASIPETARVEIGSVTAEVAYDGEPTFEPIEGTDMTYAVNTSAQVIRVDDTYYVVENGIWFVSSSPNGPWAVATAVPAQIYTIPPSSPVHNVTYVRIYRSEPGAVWFGFTTGYLFGFLAWGTIVYGSGWYYPPYWRYGAYPIYYPRPVTWGIGAYYNPARGVYGRYGYAYGPYRGIAARAGYDPRTGTYFRGARAYGPYGSRGFISAYNPRTGTRVVARGGSGIYGRWGSAAVTRGSDYVRVRGAQRAGGAKGVRWDSSRGRGFAAADRRGNVYAGRDGNVYRNTGDGWQKWGRGGWGTVASPRPEDLRRAGRQGDRSRPIGDRGAEGQTGIRRDTSRETVRREAKPRETRRQTGARTTERQTRAERRQTGPRQGRSTTRAERPRVPAHVERDRRGRQIGNQRNLQRRASRSDRAVGEARSGRNAGAARSRGDGGFRDGSRRRR